MTRATPPSDQSAASSLRSDDKTSSALARTRAAASGPSSSAIIESTIATPMASTPRSSFVAGSELNRSDKTSPLYIASRVGHGRPTNGNITPGEFLLPLDSIVLGDRLRPVRQGAVDDLIVSLREGVLAHPVTVRPTGDSFELVLGAHRVTAFRQMGRTTIPVIIRELGDLEARQLEIDENLIRAGLTALERLTFVAERVEVWAARNPDRVVMDVTRPIKTRGRPPKAFLKLRKVDGYVPELMGFATETARETGLSRQSIYRATACVAGLPAAQRDRLHGTWIASNDAALRQLAAIGEAEEQAKVIDLLLEGKTKSIPEARALANGHTPAPKVASDTVQRDFERAWKAATASQRDGLLDWLAGQTLPKGWNVIKGQV